MKFPTINFIGSKKKIATEIVDEIMKVSPNKILDGFAGSGIVSYELKNRGISVISNDALYSNYLILLTFIENNNYLFDKIKFNNEFSKTNILEVNQSFIEIATKYYREYEIPELFSLVELFKKKKGFEKSFLGTLIRRAMIRKMPYSRFNIPKEQIEKLRDEEYSYEKYKRKRAYHNETFLSHINKEIESYNKFVISSEHPCFSSNLDVIKAINKFDFDTIYLDPPYPNTMNKYNDFYGPIDNILGVSTSSLDFEKLENFIENFKKLLNKLQKKKVNIFISCNTKSEKVLKNIFLDLKITNFEEIKIAHNYQITGLENKNANEEILIKILRKD